MDSTSRCMYISALQHNNVALTGAQLNKYSLNLNIYIIEAEILSLQNND